MRQDAVVMRAGVRWWVWPLAGLGMLLCAAAASAQTNVTLRPAATIPERSDAEGGRAITLADVAEIDPPTTPDAEKLGQIVIVSNGAVNDSVIHVSQVRAAMDAAQVSWARITLRGSACRVTVVSGASTRADSPAKPTSRPTAGMGTPQPVDVRGAPTIRAAIGIRLLALYGVEQQDLRLGFDAADEGFLEQAIGDRRVDVQPTATGASARTPVNVFIYEGDQLTTTRLVSTQALINRSVVTARGPIARGEAVSPEAIESTRQWVPPNAKPSVTAESAAGQLAARNIAAGATITVGDITQPVVCKRGDIVWVHALSGGISVRAKARAMSQARDGEKVQLKLDGPAGSERVFTARMSGPGRAVMIVGGEDADGSAGGAGNAASRTVPQRSQADVRQVWKDR